MGDMTVRDAQACADIAARPWYVAAYRGRDTINIQGFAKLRPGRRLTSLAWNGFRLFEEPVDMVNFGKAHSFMPWEVWKVKPLRVLGHEPKLRHEARQIRARQLEVVGCMPPGFEFGPNGWNVRRLVEQLARAQDKQRADRTLRSEYEIAMTFLEDQRGPGGWLHDARVSLAYDYLDSLASGPSNGPFGRWKHHGRKMPAHTLIDAAVAGLPIPAVITRHWGLDQNARSCTANG
ncbi:hypothetical protein ACAG24_029205 [Mycobacterium sp. pW049]|uniref:hypothetical protein n=1 Tax=[Mycobacterium] bulgaricum TaxID=3238985 RepID=UPI0035A88F66